MRRLSTSSRAFATISGALLVAGIFQVPAANAAVTGSLVQRATCFDSSNPQCATYADLNGTTGVAVSPAGDNVYVTDYNTSNVSWFARSGTGVLSHGSTQCIGAGPGCSTAAGVTNPYAIIVSPDGKHVYVVTAASGGGIASFQRAAGGALVQLAGSDGCMTGSPTAGCLSDSYIAGAQRMAFSPNGLQLYVVTSEGRLITLTRNPTTGVLSRSGCLSANAEASCTQVIPLAGVVDVATSSDGKSVYTVSEDESGGALAQYIRASNGGLLYEDCEGPVADGCSHTAYGITGPDAVIVSPNGKSVYTAGGTDTGGLVAAFQRATTGTSLGALTQPSGTAKCISNDGSGGACVDAHGLGDTVRLAAAPDNRNLYVTTQSTTNSVVVLNRATSGQLSQPAGAAGCYADAGTQGCADGKALFQPNGVATSGDGNSVYVASYGHGGLTQYKRISPPQTTITSGPSGEIKDRTPTYRFTSSEKNSTFQCKVDDGAWKSCTSPRTLGKLSFGRHVFKVRARDAVGTFDPTPAKRRIKVVRS